MLERLHNLVLTDLPWQGKVLGMVKLWRVKVITTPLTPATESLPSIQGCFPGPSDTQSYPRLALKAEPEIRPEQIIYLGGDPREQV